MTPTSRLYDALSQFLSQSAIASTFGNSSGQPECCPRLGSKGIGQFFRRLDMLSESEEIQLFLQQIDVEFSELND